MSGAGAGARTSGAGAPGGVAAGPRHRARSPIIPPGLLPAALTAALAGLLVATAPLGGAGLLPAVAVLQAVTAAGWFRLNGMWLARQGIALATAAGLTADVALLLAPADRATLALLGTLGLWYLLVLLLQLRHRGSADERLASLGATAAATMLAVVAAGHLAAAEVAASAVAVTALGVAAAVLVRAALVRAVPARGGPGGAPGPVAGLVAGALALAAAVGAGAAAQAVGAGAAAQAVGAGAGQDAVTGAWGAGLGAAAGCCALLGLRVASYDFPSRFVHLTAGVALPLTAAAPAVYPLARLLV